MILYRLICGREHEFDAWFKSSAAYDRQAARGLLSCPTCGGGDVAKAVMAPRLNRGVAEATTMTVMAPPQALAERAMLQALRREVEKNCDYVGARFAEEARAIEAGEAPARAVYGEASEQEAKDLHAEGIAIARLPWVPLDDA